MNCLYKITIYCLSQLKPKYYTKGVTVIYFVPIRTFQKLLFRWHGQIYDEFSMLTEEKKMVINIALCNLCIAKDPFGGLNILLHFINDYTIQYLIIQLFTMYFVLIH